MQKYGEVTKKKTKNKNTALETEALRRLVTDGMKKKRNNLGRDEAIKTSHSKNWKWTLKWNGYIRKINEKTHDKYYIWRKKKDIESTGDEV